MKLNILNAGEENGGNAAENREETASRIGDWRGSEIGSNLGSLLFDNRTQREWLSTEEAACFLSITENALRIMVHRDQIPAFKMGRRLRFRVQDCRRLFQRKGE